MIKKIVTVMVVVFVSIGTILGIANAGTGGGRRGAPPTVPEPLSYILILAGGATLEAIRRLRNRRNSKNSHQDTDNTVS
ncbi:MAG: hypothetical protein HYV59_09890 [Planctomycetes bacterium]|nr:hypothetical protein [Planctomycetota bacterium]